MGQRKQVNITLSTDLLEKVEHVRSEEMPDVSLTTFIGQIFKIAWRRYLAEGSMRAYRRAVAPSNLVIGPEDHAREEPTNNSRAIMDEFCRAMNVSADEFGRRLTKAYESDPGVIRRFVSQILGIAG